MIIGRKIISLGEVASTNDIAKGFAEQGEPEGLVITARAQTRGRGRRGRGWTAHDGKSVVLSALVRPRWVEADAAWLGVLGGVATAQTIQQLGAPDVTIKWPNDVLAGGRKIAGVLVEPRLAQGKIEFAIIGIGLNVRQVADEWPDDLRGSATSLLMEGVDVDVAAVTRTLIEKLDECYRLQPPTLISSWQRWTNSAELPVLD